MKSMKSGDVGKGSCCRVLGVVDLIWDGEYKGLERSGL